MPINWRNFGIWI